MATGMTKAQARVLSRFDALFGADGGAAKLVELTKGDSDEVRYGISIAGHGLVAVVLSKEFPEDDYTMSDMGENDSE
jgi:hypothetical protein